jgi:signal transduction histidine kinase
MIFYKYRLRINAVCRNVSGSWNCWWTSGRNTLQREKERAEQANQFKGELVHIVAHDLKNPLTTIVGMSHLLQR